MLDSTIVYINVSAAAAFGLCNVQSPGTDVRPLLEGHKPILRELVNALDSELTYMLQVRSTAANVDDACTHHSDCGAAILQSYICAPLPWDLRAAVTAAIKNLKASDTLYAILFSGGHIVTYVEPRNLSLHVDDMLLLLALMMRYM